MSKKSTREDLLEEGRRALMARGYDGVGIGPVVKAVGVPKGSFYHYFESKEAFASAVLETHAQQYNVDRRAILENRSLSPLTRLQNYFDYLVQLQREEDYSGCLFGNLAQSVAARSEALQRMLKEAFQVWEGDLCRILSEAVEAGECDEGLDPAATAEFLINAYEGALLRVKTEGSDAPLRRFTNFAMHQVVKTAS